MESDTDRIFLDTLRFRYFDLYYYLDLYLLYIIHFMGVYYLYKELYTIYIWKHLYYILYLPTFLGLRLLLIFFRISTLTVIVKDNCKLTNFSA